MYYVGLGVPQNYGEAAIWCRKAAEQGNDDAEVSLADLYEEGQGVPQNYSQAIFWYRKAAEQNWDPGQYALGLMYYNGHGVPQDFAEAYFWLNLAASGKMMGWQPGVLKQRDDAASHLSNAVLLQTQERTRRWFEAHPNQSDSQ